MKDYVSLISYFASFAVAVIALIYGAGRLLKKSTLAYFHFLIWGVACFVLVSLSTCVNYICGSINNPHITLASCGIVGVLIAFLSANMGVLDKLVDERTDSTKKARTLAIIVPIIFVVILGVICADYLKAKRYDFAILLIALGIPMVLGGYFNTKHLLLPMDDMQILKATRGCNVMCLIFDITEILYILSTTYGQELITSACYFIRSVSVLVLIIFAVKGASKWSL